VIPFNVPSFDGDEVSYLTQAIDQGHTSGNGPFTKQAETILANLHDGGIVLLTSSCTHALEMAARLLDLQPGDEVIVPSYTFVSTASAFLWNGAKPVFADIRPDTLNIDPQTVEDRITDRTKAICIVHYAGVGAEPDLFVDLAKRHHLVLIEDNAHGLGAKYRGQTLGTFGALSTLSFHETKNVTCGEGGALVINDASFVERAEKLREKGTDRSLFMRGQVNKYTWVDVGSNWVMSDLLAAVLLGQLERFHEIQERRQYLWHRYLEGLSEWAKANEINLPFVPVEAEHSAHIFYLRLQSQDKRDRFINHMRRRGIGTVFHYQALHASPVGKSLGNHSNCPTSTSTAETLVRLPLFMSMTEIQQDQVIDAVRAFPR